MEALKTRPIGHFKNAKLTPEQQKALVNIILTKDPTYYGFYKALWSRDIVAAVIKTEFDITMHPAAVGNQTTTVVQPGAEEVTLQLSSKRGRDLV